MPLIFLLLMLPSGLFAQQMKAIQDSAKSMHNGFATLTEEVAKKLPYLQNTAKNITYSFDGTDGRRTGLSMSITYRYKIDNAVFTNTFTYAPDEANYYLTYLNGLEFFQPSAALSYQVVPLKKGGEKSYLWHTKDKIAILVPSAGEGVSQGFFIKIIFPKDIKGEGVVVEDIASRIDWASLRRLFAP